MKLQLDIKTTSKIMAKEEQHSKSTAKLQATITQTPTVEAQMALQMQMADKISTRDVFLQISL